MVFVVWVCGVRSVGVWCLYCGCVVFVVWVYGVRSVGVWCS